MLKTAPGAATPQDSARTADVHARRLWRASQDPHFRDVLDLWGEAGLDASGFFDDDRSPDELARLHRPWPMTTPTFKLTRPEGSDSRAPLVTLVTGAFSPVHAGHLGMLHQARTRLEHAGHFVAGGYLSADHDTYVFSKYHGGAALGADWRLQLLQDEVADTPDVMACPWNARWVRSSVNFTDVAARLQAYLRAHWNARTEVVLVVGADNANFARAYARNGRLVVLPRPGAEANLSAVQAETNLQAAQAEGRVLLTPCPAEQLSLSASSSEARQSGVNLSSSALRTLASIHPDENSWPAALTARLAGTAAPSSPTGPEGEPWYALRADLQWATAAWTGQVGTRHLQRLNAAFQAGLLKVFTQNLLGLQVDLLDLQAQQQRATELQQTETVLSLDALSTGSPVQERGTGDGHAGRNDEQWSLHLSRLFGLADGQHHSLQMVQRPGHPDIAAQLARLPAGQSVTLTDDDVASGQTMGAVRALLDSRNIDVTRQETLLQAGSASPRPQPPVDVCDMRDFLLGAREAGLVVTTPAGTPARALYAAPWVNLHARAKLPTPVTWAFSERIWELNLDFHRRSGLRVRDAWEASRELLLADGWTARTLLSTICRHHLQAMREPESRNTESQGLRSELRSESSLA